ncbi:MAG: hypothetical protein V2J62_10380, partial [candidate division KSB1 bacterium]|nr:hypothetical protein [candidate division KSB1 bacterium]
MKAVQLRQLLLLIILVLAFLLVVSAFIVTSSGFAAAKPELAVLYAEAGADAKKKDIIQYRDDNVIIFGKEEIRADILVIDGIITVNGTVYGDVIGIRSDVILENSAVVFGNIICYQGDVRKESGSTLAGDVIRFDEDDVITVKYRDNTEYTFPYHVFSDDDEIDVESYETISGDVILVDGEISVRGKIDGDIIALDSDVEIIESAAVDGHVIAYDSECDIEDGALITGVTIETEEIEDEDEDVEYADDREADIQRSIERKYLNRHDDVIRFFGDATIESNEIIEGEVVVMKGTATLRGEINGDVVAIFGDVDIDSSAYVSGNVVSVGGKIFKAPGAYVGGDVIRTTWTGAKIYDDEDEAWEDYDREREREREREYDRSHEDRYYVDRWSGEENELDDFLFRYNRVEGLFLGFMAPKNRYERLDRNHVKVFGHAGYGFKSKEARYRVGIERWVFNDFRFTIGAEVFDLTDTQDRWIMPSFENTLAALLLKEDFHDFYRRVGFNAYARQNLTENFRVEVGYRKDKFYN